MQSVKSGLHYIRSFEQELKLILIKLIGALLLIWHYFFINFQICLTILKLAYQTSLSQDILMSKQCSGVKSYVKSMLAISMILGLDSNVRIDDFRACYQILEFCSQLLAICLVYCFLFECFCQPHFHCARIRHPEMLCKISFSQLNFAKSDGSILICHI